MNGGWRIPNGRQRKNGPFAPPKRRKARLTPGLPFRLGRKAYSKVFLNSVSIL